MAEHELPIVITAIADAQTEGFIASGLLHKGGQLFIEHSIQRHSRNTSQVILI